MKNYPSRYHELRRIMGKMQASIPATMRSYGALHTGSMSEGVLSSKHKELIALGIAITQCCDGCIAYHVHDALQAGATAEEIHETIGVSILMGGGPSVVYGCEALEAVEQFESENTSA